MTKRILCSIFFALLTGFSLHSSAIQNKGTSAEFHKGCRKIECTLTSIPSKYGKYRRHEGNEEHNFSKFSRPQGTRLNKLSDETQLSASLNWSGYAALTDLDNPKNYSVEQVSASWTVPTVIATPYDAYSSAWVGIDGYFPTSQTVQQIGTEHDYVGDTAQYYAWFEMYPQGSYLINGFPVNPGDEISAKVKYHKDNIFILTIANKTEQVYTKIFKSYTVQPIAVRTSAEWILEAPSNEFGDILPLANYGRIHFFDCEAVIKNKEGSISKKKWENAAITMISDTLSSNIISVPSPLEENGTSFNIVWAATPPPT